MNHKEKVFHFINTKGRAVEVIAKPYTFEIEDVLKKRVGKEAWVKFITTQNLVFDITFDCVVEDFPQLLDAKGQKINWRKQNFDEIQKVYNFFFEYKRSAKLREFESEAETLRLKISELKDLLLSTQGNIFQKVNQNTSPSG